MSELLIENRDNGVRILCLNRPQKHNALDTALTSALLAALLDAGEDATCRAIVLTGAGASFCAGADTSEFAALSDTADEALKRADLTMRLHGAFTRIDTPVVAAVCGNALGGGAGLALACDLVIAAGDMRLGYPELRHGIVPAVVMANLVRQVGRKTAFSLVATGRVINGSEAERLGIAHASVPAPQVLETAVTLAALLASWSPAAMSTTKRLFHRVADLSLDQGLLAGRDTNVIMRGFHKQKAASQ